MDADLQRIAGGKARSGAEQRWYSQGESDARAGLPPRSVLDGHNAIPEEMGRVYNQGYRAGGGPLTYVLPK